MYEWRSIAAETYDNLMEMLTMAMLEFDAMDGTGYGMSFDCSPKGDPSKRSPDYIGAQKRAYTMEEFLAKYKGKSRKQILNDLDDCSKTFLKSQRGGPGYRYVINPRDGRIIDMRHMLIVGSKPPLVGTMIEFGQIFTDKDSALSRQDFYSNSVGYHFYEQYPGYLRLITPNSFTEQLEYFFYGPKAVYYH